MRNRIPATLLITLLAIGPAVAGGEIYGTVTTTDGERLTGPIHWDSQENFWNDVMDARKTEAVEPADPDDGFRFSLFGWEIVNTKDSATYHQLTVPFGHLSAVEPDGSKAAILEFKDGSRVRADASTSDLGRNLEIVVHDRERGEVELSWRRIARVDFSAGPGKGRDATRLYGTVTFESGELSGFVMWDRDESLIDDLLDGEADGTDREIAFGKIASIEPRGSSAAKVTLKGGEELELRGTNDVNDEMRGLLITVDGLGVVEVEWEELRKVVFSEAPASPKYDSFDGGRRLSGTVHTRDGRPLAGSITWDLDETHSWESLDGEHERISYEIEFAHVRSVAPVGDHEADVTLTDGRKLRLSGSNDVNVKNKGIVVVGKDGSREVVDWSSIDRVEFE